MPTVYRLASRKDWVNTVAIMADDVRIESDAFRLICLQLKKKIPDISHISLIKNNTIQVNVPEGDFVIRINDYPDRRLTRLDIRVTFREPEEAGGTWWSQWFVDVPQPKTKSQTGQVLIKEIVESRQYFARLIDDTRAAAQRGSLPVVKPSCGGRRAHRDNNQGPK